MLAGCTVGSIFQSEPLNWIQGTCNIARRLKEILGNEKLIYSATKPEDRTSSETTELSPEIKRNIKDVRISDPTTKADH